MCQLCELDAICLNIEFLPGWFIGIIGSDSEHCKKGNIYISKEKSNEVASVFTVKPVKEDHEDFSMVSYTIESELYLRPMEAMDLVSKAKDNGYSEDDDFTDWFCNHLAIEIEEMELKRNRVFNEQYVDFLKCKEK